jgi:hypothetical protein
MLLGLSGLSCFSNTTPESPSTTLSGSLLTVEDEREELVLIFIAPVDDTLEEPVLIFIAPVDDTLEEPVLIFIAPVDDTLEEPVLIFIAPVEDATAPVDDAIELSEERDVPVDTFKIVPVEDIEERLLLVLVAPVEVATWSFGFLECLRSVSISSIFSDLYERSDAGNCVS